MTKNIALAFLLVVCTLATYGHDARESAKLLQTWHLKNGGHLQASFLMMRKDSVFLETGHGTIKSLYIGDLSEKGQSLARARYTNIERLNAADPASIAITPEHPHTKTRLGGLLLTALLLPAFFFLLRKKTWWKVMAVTACVSLFFSFNKRFTGFVFTTDPFFIDAAFDPYKPHVATHWDNNWFYVESKGIPTTHSMMTGITKWQQQVPLPQCYIGDNAWQIPLNPVLAANPVPVNPQHFLRGAVAIAANGVPIFNPYTNTGVDALVDGQLDQWGGHSGRADDYHYHIAPLHLQEQTEDVLPIAFALDGFAIYGSVEPDGTPMLPLDNNHGHYDQQGVYHYHGTTNAPYMIGNMVGQVTEDATLQIVPQAHAMPVRPSLTPLNGAAITNFQPNFEGNGYILTYTRNGQTFQVAYNWTQEGVYTYNFIAPSGTTTEVYNGFTPCEVPTGVADLVPGLLDLTLFPNPTKGLLMLKINSAEGYHHRIRAIYLYDVNGRPVFQQNQAVTVIDASHLPKGVYWLRVIFEEGELSRKIVLQ